MLLSHGGTENIQDLNRYSEPGRRLIGSLGIDVKRYSEFHDDQLYRSQGMRRAVFFGRESFGTDRLAVGVGQPSWREFFARTPLSETARKELVRLYDSDVDYLQGRSLKDKVKYLQQTSYEEFLLENAKIGPEAVSFVWRSSTWAIGLDSTAVNVRHRGDPTSAEEIEVTYVRGDRAHRVRGGHGVLACYNAAIPHICDELPAAQKEALSQAVKAPLIYTNVLIRNGTAFARLGIRGARCPGSYFESIDLTEPVNISAYRHSSKPAEALVKT